MNDVSPRWSDPRTVAGFVSSPPNAQLLEFATGRLGRAASDRCLDIGCGAGRNAAPLAELGYRVVGTDLAEPMLHAARERVVSSTEFRAAVAEAARVARTGAGLFLFTFSRHTLPGDALPDAGEPFVFSSWNGEPQCFLTESEIVKELAGVGFIRVGAGPLTEYNLPRPGELRAGGPPVIYEATFVRVRSGTAERVPE